MMREHADTFLAIVLKRLFFVNKTPAGHMFTERFFSYAQF